MGIGPPSGPAKAKGRYPWACRGARPDGGPTGTSRRNSVTSATTTPPRSRAAGFQSLARGASRHFAGGAVRQTIIEMESAFLFVMAAGQGACLAVLAAQDADVGLIAYEMAMLATRAGHCLTTPVRVATPSHA